jgi:SAM-dependent methyltransferase|tara:strand:+ start:93 stop:782 length:690 start_codon:yes stop_codon:yes gene_type:complete
MAQETRKSNRIRSDQYFQDYCQGDVIDIGAGDNKITDDAVVFDVNEGNAQNILDYVETESFDCVYSSHCLEHMQDARATINQWWKILRPGGYMIIVVPDEDLYEQQCWPSMFNSDHKHTFTISKPNSWSMVSINLKDLLCGLDGAELINIEIQSDGYDHNLREKNISPRMHSLWNYKKSTGLKKHLKHLVYRLAYYPYLRFDWLKRGRPIDQTEGDALAQIEAIVRKRV